MAIGSGLRNVGSSYYAQCGEQNLIWFDSLCICIPPDPERERQTLLFNQAIKSN